MPPGACTADGVEIGRLVEVRRAHVHVGPALTLYRGLCPWGGMDDGLVVHRRGHLITPSVIAVWRILCIWSDGATMVHHRAAMGFERWQPGCGGAQLSLSPPTLSAERRQPGCGGTLLHILTLTRSRLYLGRRKEPLPYLTLPHLTSPRLAHGPRWSQSTIDTLEARLKKRWVASLTRSISTKSLLSRHRLTASCADARVNGTR